MTDILNTALIIVIVLDVVGAAVYFTVTCMSRFREARAEARVPRHALAGSFGGMIPATAGSVSTMALYGPAMPVADPTAPETAPESLHRPGFRGRIESFGKYFSNITSRSAALRPDEAPVPEAGIKNASESETSDPQVRNHLTRLNKILNSFKEDI